MKRLYQAANTGRDLILLVVGSWLVAATLFAIIEHKSILDSLYWSMTTLSTVGYGDLSPSTNAGKVLTMAFQAWSIFFIVPNAVAHVIDKMRKDEHKYTDAEQDWTEESFILLAKHLGVTLPTPPSDTDYEV